jgi:uncharacterized Zn finger protein (UPF0148 family)
MSDPVAIHERTHCDGCGRALDDAYAYNGQLLCPQCFVEYRQWDQFVALDSRPVAKTIDEGKLLWD